MAPTWNAVVVEIPAELEDELVALVPDTCLGAEFRGTERGRLAIYTESRATADELARRIADRLQAHGLNAGRCGLGVEEIEDGRWVERYMAGLRPFPLGRRFIVDPKGSEPAGGERIPIVLVPGRAFGTGEHPTTRLCAAELERRVRGESRWVDLGCGSGILSIVAHHCGAAKVLGLDSDGEAIGVARRALAANGLERRIDLRRASADEGGTGRWDGVVANISAEYFAMSARAAAALLRPAGTFIASGFLDGRADEVASALTRAGLCEAARTSNDGWGLLRACRPGS